MNLPGGSLPRQISEAKTAENQKTNLQERLWICLKQMSQLQLVSRSKKKKNKQEKTDAHIMLTLNVDALELNANSRLASL